MLAVDWASKITAWATLGAAAIALIALLGAIYQIRRLRASEREARTHAYVARYNDTSQIKFAVRMSMFVSLKDSSEEQRLEEWEQMTYKRRLLTVHYLNFWEELAGMYNAKLVERPLVRDYFGTAALNLWSRTNWFIVYLRGSNERAMHELERMCEDIRDKRAKTAKKAKGTTS